MLSISLLPAAEREPAIKAMYRGTDMLTLAADAAQEAFSVAKATICCSSNPRYSRQLEHAACKVVDTHNLSLSISTAAEASPTNHGCIKASAVDALYVPFSGSIAQSSIACRDMPHTYAEQLTAVLIEALRGRYDTLVGGKLPASDDEMAAELKHVLVYQAHHDSPERPLDPTKQTKEDFLYLVQLLEQGIELQHAYVHPVLNMATLGVRELQHQVATGLKQHVPTLSWEDFSFDD